MTRLPLRPGHGPLIAAALALSLLLGVVTGALGAALPLLRSAYGLADGSGTELVVLYNLGALLAIVGCGIGLGRRLGRALAPALLLAFAGSSAGMALAPTWGLLCALALVAGAGYGGLILHLNSYFARSSGARPALLLNVLHACFGAGATLGPLLVGQWGGTSGLLLVAGALSLLLFRAAAATGEPVDRPEGAAAPRPSAPLLAVLALLALLYAGVEAGIGALESTHLAASGHSPAAAARATALFWAGLTVGRLVLPVAAHRLPHPRLIGLCLLAATGALTATLLDAVAPVAYGLAGLALAAVFPTTLAWANALLPDPHRVNSALLVANLVGSTALPYLIGLAAAPGNRATIPVAFAGLTLLCGLTLAGAARLARRPVPRAPRPAPHNELETSP
ncbi:MFS transporter [Streptomyces lunalinharesii]|uniref:MFS transporter n=1 Tax=Streptomyces lunalinharesii TaxID=333384 RepID=A0ABN3R5U9_9ACTN